nr:hypothetical protein CFP56_33489 [Quercus suber]
MRDLVLDFRACAIGGRMSRSVETTRTMKLRHKGWTATARIRSGQPRTRGHDDKSHLQMSRDVPALRRLLQHVTGRKALNIARTRAL